MKRQITALLIISSFAILSFAQSSVDYYMPKTILAFDITYTKTELTQGIFYQYAERYLNTKDIVLGDHLQYELISIELSTTAVADRQHPYSIPLDNAKISVLPTLTSDGRLVGINLQDNDLQEVETATVFHNETAQTAPIMPLLEEQMMASSIARMAESTAKQIYRIRENRFNLLTGDVENMPADGQAMKIALDELEREEKALTELFVGRRTTTTISKRITFEPKKSIDKHILFRFSEFTGLVAADDLSGEPYMLNITMNTVNQQPAQTQQANQKPQFNLYYYIPDNAKVELVKGLDTILSSSLQIAQSGTIASLPQTLFSGKQPARVLLDPNTGAIKKIEK